MAARTRSGKRKTANGKRQTVRTRRARSVHVNSPNLPNLPYTPNSTFLSDPRNPLLVLMAIPLVLLFLLLVWKRNWVVPALVNGKPVLGTELFSRMNAENRKMTLDNIVNERIILDEAKKRNLTPTKEEVDSRMAKEEAKYGGKEAFNALIEQSGQKRVFIENQVKLSIAMEKMYAADVTVSDVEITNYLKENAALLTETDPAKQKIEAETNVREQKIRQILADKFNELKASAKVRIF